jgi:hypothetical protein
MRIPYWLLKQLPMWDYICPKCKREVEQKSHKCPYCEEQYGVPLRVPPKVLKDNKVLEEYVHKHVFPKVSASQRKYLTRFFTVLFSDGFENDFTPWTSTGGTPTIVTDPVHHGAKAMNGNASGDYASKTVTAQTHIFARGYFRWDAYPSSGTTIYFMRLAHAGTNEIDLRIQPSGAKAIVAGWSRRGLSLGGSTLLDLNVWYCIEVEYLVAVSGYCKVYLNGNLEINSSGDTSLSVDIDEVQVGPYEANTVDPFNEYVDCVVIADAYIGVEVEVVPVGGTVQQAKLQDII